MTVKKSCAIVTGWSELKLGRSPAVERLLDAGRAMTHGHIDLGALRDVATAVLDELPGIIGEVAGSGCIHHPAVAAQRGRAQGTSAGVGGHEVKDGRHAGFPRGHKNLGIEPAPTASVSS